MIDKNTIIDIAKSTLAHCDIVEVISTRIKVIQAGRNYKAICPFHDDSNPSMMISKEKQIFKCFVCGTSGNAISFIQKFDKVNFLEALKEVSRICGYEDPRLKELENRPVRHVENDLQAIYNCLNDINNFYQAGLFQSADGKTGMDYLKNRGLDDDTIKFFNIGWSMSDGNNIINYLKSKNYSIKTIERTGIGHINVQSMSIRDNNAGRVIFPLIDREGQCVGFSARRINNDDNVAKYINTESTEAFNKGNILYNLNNAKNSAKGDGFIYLLEGFMDVIALYRVGIRSAVALMGTALTKDQIRELRYLNVEVRVCLDLDRAGQMNTNSAIQKLEDAGVKYKIVNNLVSFNEKDCDEILTNLGDNELLKYVNNLIDRGEWLINYYSRTLNLNNSADKKLLVKSIMPYVAKAKSKFDVEDYITRLSNMTQYSKTILYEFLDTFKRNETSLTDDERWFNNIQRKKFELSALDLAQFKIVRYMLENKDAVEVFSNCGTYLPTQKYRVIANLLKEYILSVPSDETKLKVDDVINYLSVSDEVENKDQIISDVTDIAFNTSVKFPPYKPEELVETTNALNDLRQEKREKQNLIEATNASISPEEKARIAKSFIEKKKRNLKK